nr:MAG TPA: hypothetical protein [Caudoviricetes sp.]
MRVSPNWAKAAPTTESSSFEQHFEIAQARAVM